MDKLKDKKTIALIVGVVLSVVVALSADVSSVVKDVCTQLTAEPSEPAEPVGE